MISLLFRFLFFSGIGHKNCWLKTLDLIKNCYCVFSGSVFDPILGGPGFIDPLDGICKEWAGAAKCLQTKGGTCFPAQVLGMLQCVHLYLGAFIFSITFEVLIAQRTA